MRQAVVCPWRPPWNRPSNGGDPTLASCLQNSWLQFCFLAGWVERERQSDRRGRTMLGTILLILLILLLIGAVPAWPYSRGWGYGPSGGLGVVLAVVLILLLLRAI